jgi:hypothetical protein
MNTIVDLTKPTMEEVLELVEFGRSDDGKLFVSYIHGNVMGDVDGNLEGNVWGSIKGYVNGNIGENVWGTINGRYWEFTETNKEYAIRLIREGNAEEAIKVLEENE